MVCTLDSLLLAFYFFLDDQRITQVNQELAVFFENPGTHIDARVTVNGAMEVEVLDSPAKILSNDPGMFWRRMPMSVGVVPVKPQPELYQSVSASHRLQLLLHHHRTACRTNQRTTSGP